MADTVVAALPRQTTFQGYYNVEKIVKSIVSKAGQVRLCGAGCEAPGIKAIPLQKDVEISTMIQLAQWTVASDEVLVVWLIRMLTRDTFRAWIVRRRAPQ